MCVLNCSYNSFRNITLLNKEGLAPKIYGVFKNGLVYEYYPGVTLNTETVTDTKISTLVARQMAKMHKVQLGPEVSSKMCTVMLRE